MHDPLEISITATHDVLDTRLSTAEFSRPDARNPRARFPTTDTFLASASRHVAAANEVLVDACRRHLSDGEAKARQLTARSRHLEQAMAQAKAKLYGGSQAVRRPWSEIWVDLHREFDAFMELEEKLAGELVNATAPEFHDRLAERIHRAELKAPTRPHPYVPHRGLTGRVARRLALRVDLFWDTTEARMIPAPVRPHDRSKDGPLRQYLLADPHLDGPTK